MLLIFLSVLLVTTSSFTRAYESRDVRGRLFDDTLSVSSRLYPTKVRADDSEEPEPRRFARHKGKEIRGAEQIPIGEIKEHETKSFPVSAGYSVQEEPNEQPQGQGHRGQVFDDAAPYRKPNYQGYSLDEYIKSVTNPNLRTAPPTTPSPKPLISDVKNILRGEDNYKQSFGEKSKTKGTKYIADFDNAFILPEDKIPFGLGSNIEVVKGPKIGKKNRKTAEYLRDYNIKDIQIEHERQLDELESYAKPKPGGSATSSTSTFNFGEVVPYGKAKAVTKTTTPPSYNYKSTKPTKWKQTYGNLQGAASSSFSNASEDEKLEQAVREALTHLRKSQRARGRANGAATKLNPVKASPDGARGGPQGPGGPRRRPRRPFNSGPSPVRVFNFNN